MEQNLNIEALEALKAEHSLMGIAAITHLHTPNIPPQVESHRIVLRDLVCYAYAIEDEMLINNITDALESGELIQTEGDLIVATTRDGVTDENQHLFTNDMEAFKFHKVLSIANPEKYIALTKHPIKTVEQYVWLIEAFQAQVEVKLKGNKKTKQPEAPKKGKKPDIAKKVAKDKYDKYIQACKDRRENISALWDRVLELQEERRIAMAFFSERVEQARSEHIQAKGSPAPRYEDFY